LADSGDDLPGLATFDWFFEMIGFGTEKDEMRMITSDFRICCKILIKGIPDTGIDHDFLTFAPLLFLDPKSSFDILIVVQEMFNL